MARDITYKNVAKSRRALASIEGLTLAADSAIVCETVTSALKELILSVAQHDIHIQRLSREVRRLTFAALRRSVPGDVADLFKNGELENIPLDGMSFAGEMLSGLSFKGCFLAEADFAGCDLSGASFEGAWLRNVNFANAKLANADLTDADWFHSAGLSELQLASAQRDTLLPCPRDLEGMIRDLSFRYGHTLDSWSGYIQEQLNWAWASYWRHGNLKRLAGSLF
jgi:hypothetical protein